MTTPPDVDLFERSRGRLEAIAYRLSPNQSFFGRLFAMRVANVLLDVLTIGLMWALAGEIFARRWLQVLATAVVA